MSLNFRILAAAAVLSGVTGLKAAGDPGAPAAEKPRLEVHEWGTFLSVQGSNGVSLGGVVESEEELPVFVERRTNPDVWKRAFIRQKMETPVTYFYTDRPMRVEVRVDMPEGVLTHWFPAARGIGPGPAPETGTYLDWGGFDLIPDTPASPGEHPLRDTEPGSTWRFAREVDAALVRAHAGDIHHPERHDFEKFLFYRGLGTFDLPLEVRGSGPDTALRLDLRNRSDHPLRGLLAIRIQESGIRFAALPDLGGGEARAVDAGALLGRELPLDEGAAAAKHATAAALAAGGLFPREAQAMVNTWDHSYFRTPGLRILYIIPRPVTDAVIPITIRPAPDELVRVMVGRIEVLTPDTEQRIEKLLASLESDSRAARESAQRELERFGRLLEPALRRASETAGLPEIAGRARRLIAAGAAAAE